MKPLKSVEQTGSNLNVILRMDTDLPIEDGKILDNSRILKSIPTIKLLLKKGNKVVVVGHRGRPQGKDDDLSLRVVYAELMTLLERDGENVVENIFIEDIKNESEIKQALENNQLVFVENLRFWPEEEKGDTSLFKTLKKYCTVYVNDAFAVAHRRNASVMLFKELMVFYGLSFIEETNKICQIIEHTNRPLTIILGGAKEDKLNYLTGLLEKTDYVLIGGKLPKLINDQFPISNDQIKNKIIVAELNEEGLDLSEKDIEKFKEIINKSKMVIWAGAMGLYEKENYQEGTEEIAKAVAKNNGYKIIAGGDTGASIANLGLRNKINFVCSGGGVMLEFLAKGTLPAWE
jgi:phosphoglycerate kinase